MHAKVRRESLAGYATHETLVCGPKEHTRWWQRYRGQLQGLLYRFILNSYLSQLHWMSLRPYLHVCFITWPAMLVGKQTNRPLKYASIRRLKSKTASLRLRLPGRHGRDVSLKCLVGRAVVSSLAWHVVAERPFVNAVWICGVQIMMPFNRGFHTKTKWNLKNHKQVIYAKTSVNDISVYSVENINFAAKMNCRPPCRASEATEDGRQTENINR